MHRDAYSIGLSYGDAHPYKGLTSVVVLWVEKIIALLLILIASIVLICQLLWRKVSAKWLNVNVIIIGFILKQQMSSFRSAVLYKEMMYTHSNDRNCNSFSFSSLEPVCYFKKDFLISVFWFKNIIPALYLGEKGNYSKVPNIKNFRWWWVQKYK